MTTRFVPGANAYKLGDLDIEGARSPLDRADALDLARTFRQSPNTEYARAAANSLRESISINERLQSAWGPYVAYVVLPLFALANAGVRLSGEILLGAVVSPVAWGVLVGLVVGKFAGVFGSLPSPCPASACCAAFASAATRAASASRALAAFSRLPSVTRGASGSSSGNGVSPGVGGVTPICHRSSC